MAEEIKCTIGPGNRDSIADVVVAVDAARVRNSSVVFSYLGDPTVTSVTPNFTIPSGGVTLTFIGENLGVIQMPAILETKLLFSDSLVRHDSHPDIGLLTVFSNYFYR